LARATARRADGARTGARTPGARKAVVADEILRIVNLAGDERGRDDTER
jgi:hypothetical protein